MITTQDWLDLMPIVKDRGWGMVDGRIRDKDGFCPICAILNEACGTTEKTRFWLALASAEIKPYSDGSDAIIFAADVPTAHERPALMQALGMT